MNEIEATSVSNAYRFAGVGLSPGLIRQLAPEVLTPGEVFQRRDLAERVEKWHLEQGGIKSPVSILGQAKKALQLMNEAGEIDQVTSSRWRYMGAGSSRAAPDIIDGVAAEQADDYEDLAEDDLLTVENESGEGTGTVYVYYFPGYAKENEPYPLKIGMSETGFQSRILMQLGTSHPERPVVYRAHHTDRPRLIERYLHAALKIEGLWMEDAPGAEWFNTYPEHVDELLNFVGELPEENT